MRGSLCPKACAGKEEALGAGFLKLLQLFSVVRQLLHEGQFCSFGPFCFLPCQAGGRRVIPSVTVGVNLHAALD